MAIRISGNTVITDSRVLQNVTGFKTVAGQAILGTGDIAVGGNYAMQVFTSPGTWTKPTGLKAIRVTVIGGGGASGNAAPAPLQPQITWPGGGGGGAAIEYLNAPAIPGPVTITVGAGGNQTNPASLSGNTSSFGAFCTATGGTTGRASPGPAAGGIGTGGTYNVPGEPGRITSRGSMTLAYNFTRPAPIPQGGPSPDSTNVPAVIGRTGDGGRSLLGDGGSGSLSAGNGTNQNPSPDFAISGREGTGYGAGASGQFNQGGTGSSGANGTPGIVIVEEFY